MPACPSSSQIATSSSWNHTMVKLENLINQKVSEDSLHAKVPLAGECCTDNVCAGSLMAREEGHPIGKPAQKLEEARQFINEFYDSMKRKGSPEHVARLEDMEQAMAATGKYIHTLEELEYGAKTAWRNAPRCIGRIQWKNLKVFDGRHASTASEMFDCILEHIKYATNGGAIRSTITVFPPLTSGVGEFRVWNSQLVQYAGYKNGEEIIGDPSSANFTKLLQSLGWKGKGGRFDVLPLLLQANGKDPEWFEIPQELVLEVQIRHPEYPSFKELGLKWYALPAVANMRFDCGGVDYIACPFNGWYMGTEIGARDLCDVQRYNCLPAIGKLLGLDVNRPSSLWKDRALVEVNVAVLHSFQEDGVTITDHHTASESFMQHLAMETASRGGCPADWVWIVPPLSGSACPVFHQEMVKYSLKPSYEYQPQPWAMDELGRPFIKQKVKQEETTKKSSLATISKSIVALISLRNLVAKSPKVTILYATETGRSLLFAKQTSTTLRKQGVKSRVVCMEDYKVNQLLEETTLLVVTSTFGSGDPPENGRVFWDEICALQDPLPLENLRYSVLALGSSAFPQFCQFGRNVDSFLAESGASSIAPLSEADEMKGQEAAHSEWMGQLLQYFSNGKSDSVVGTAEKSFRCRFLENGRTTPSNKVIESIHDVEVTLVMVKQAKELQRKNLRPKYFDVQLRADPEDYDATYEPGDHLQVFAGNTRKDVQMVLSRTQVTSGQYTTPLQLEVKDSSTGDWGPDDRFPEPISLLQGLTWFLDLMAPATAKFRAAVNYQEPVNDGPPGYNEIQQTKTSGKEPPPMFIEVIQEASPGSIPPELLLEHLPSLKPRRYSLSSSPRYETKPNYNITFKQIEYVRKGSKLKGLATGYLTTIPVGHKIHCNIAPSKSFRLSLAGSKPSVMVAQGTGISPFRAFWRHKMALKGNNKNQVVGPLHLFYGCRNPAADYLYKKEIKAMETRGVLETVHVGFSRDEKSPKTYVQDLLMANVNDVGHVVFDQGGYLFYCGDVGNWDNICSVLTLILQQYASLSEDKAKQYIQQMKAGSRLTRDVFVD